MSCPCGSYVVYEKCCQPYHVRKEFAPTAEALMRSRYCAFVKHEYDYLYDTTYRTKRTKNLRKGLAQNAHDTRWVQLEIIEAQYDTVEFKAYYLDRSFNTYVLHEKSTFIFEDGLWFYVDAEFY